MQDTTLPPTKMNPPMRRRCCSPSPAAFAVFALLPLAAGVVAGVFPATSAHAAGPPARRDPGPQEGDILRIFDGARVCIVTNDDPALAAALFLGTQPKERRVLTLDEWQALPAGAADFFTVVFLINREKLPVGQVFPEKCEPADDELWTQMVRRGRDWGVAYDITLSAPDGTWLRRAVSDFRRLKAPARRAEPLKMAVASLAVVPVGAGAEEAAKPLLATVHTVDGLERPAHIVPPAEVVGRAGRMADVDEIVLIDRSSVRPGEEVPAPVAEGIAGRLVGQNDTVAWREKKPGGRSRVVVTAPTAGMLTDALRRYPDPLSVPEEPVTLSSPRDLRQVRRIAVAAVRGGPGADLAHQLADRVTSEVRALDSFEVLERSGLTEVLSEIALTQAGITQPANRTRVRQIAAADALLIVEVTGVTGRTQYSARHERMTPKIGAPPPKPAEPSRLRYDISLPGKENDSIARAVTDALLGKVVGKKSGSDYREARRSYDEEILPEYERQRSEYYEYARTRPISWKQTLVAKSGVTVTGSLRLVDLTDGLVLWEKPFSVSERDETPAGSQTVTTYGENSHPGDAECPPTTDDVPEPLKTKAAEEGACDAIAALKSTALLPPPTAGGMAVTADGSNPAPVPTTPEPITVGGRILDIDGPLVLVGVGATDGVSVGDQLIVTLPNRAGTVRLKVTRVRPRTCDTTFVAATQPLLRTKIAAGMEAKKQAGSTTSPATGPGSVVSNR